MVSILGCRNPHIIHLLYSETPLYLTWAHNVAFTMPWGQITWFISFHFKNNSRLHSCGTLHWTLEQKKDISGKTNETQRKPWVQFMVIYQCWFLSCDKFTVVMWAASNGGAGQRAGGTLYYLCNISANVKLFQSKKSLPFHFHIQTILNFQLKLRCKTLWVNEHILKKAS